MKTIEIYNPTKKAYIANSSTKSTNFPITDKCERNAKLMGDDYVRLVFDLEEKVTFDAFSFIIYNGQTFFLKENYVPSPNGTIDDIYSGTVSSVLYSYDMRFVSVANMLNKHVCYRHVKVTGAGEWYEPEININGTLDTMYVIVMGAIKRAAEEWKSYYYGELLNTIYERGMAADGINPNYENVKLTKGTKLLTFNFSGNKIDNVCTTIANSFTNDDKKDTEWYITENNNGVGDTKLTLHFAKCVSDENPQTMSDYMYEEKGEYSFAYKYHSGWLKKVNYAQEWTGVTQTLVPYGSDRNMSGQSVKGIDVVTKLQSTFGKRLRLDVYEKDGKTPKTYEVVDSEGRKQYITVNSNGAITNEYVNTGIEEVKFFDDIYPQGHFKVTKVETKNKRQDGEIIPEYTIDAIAVNTNGEETVVEEGFFPIQIEEGTTLSVRFESGLLNGREFEIANKTRKDEGKTTYSLKFTIVADGSIEDGTLIPSGNFIPRKDDTFALFNMKMPDVYIEQAKQELAQRAYEELLRIQQTRPEVKCKSDPVSFDGNIALGNPITIVSELFANDPFVFFSRVISYSHKLTTPKDIDFSLSSAVMQGTLSSMNDLIADVTHQAGGLEQRAINLSRRAWRDASEMANMIDSLAADMMLIGDEKYQFAFTADIEIVNSRNQTTSIKIGDGTLQHTQDPYISEYNCKGWWAHNAITLDKGRTKNGEFLLTSLPDTPFYLYAVVGQTSDNITFELHDKEKDGEEYLLLGILSSEFERLRVLNRTNGFTQIAGGTITTEQIQDAGRNLIIDFQSNRIIARNGAEIIGNIKFKASDEMTAEEQLAALGVGVSNAISTVEQSAYANIYNGGDISFTNNHIEIYLPDAFIKIATLGCYVKFTNVSETPLTPSGCSCIVAIKKGVDISQIYSHLDDIYAYLNWGDEYTPTEECDFYVVLAQKEYLQYIFENTLNTIECSEGVWTISGINVIVRTTDAIQSAMQAIAEEEDARTEALAEAVSNINGGIDELQKQIDGEVSSYFYPYSPINDDESVKTDIEPMSEWLKNYRLTKDGVYSLKSNASNELINNLGDTFTNTETYKDDTDTPLAGKSWRWCDATNNTDVTKYITVSYTKDGVSFTKRLHWHIITDTDAIRALEAAKNAQSTADHKSTIFTTQPNKYSIGDMWILMEDTRVGGTLYQKGTVLNSSANSEVFHYSHWSEDVKYIDEDKARKQAQQALDGLEIGSRNLVLDSNFTLSAGANTTNKMHSLQFVFDNDLQQLRGRDVALSMDVKIVNVIGGTTSTFKRVLFEPVIFYKDGSKQRLTLEKTLSTTETTNFSGRISKSFKIEDKEIDYINQKAVYIQGVLSGEASISKPKWEYGTKATDWTPAPEDVDSKADAIKAIAEDALEDAAASNAQLANMSNDSILTPQEKGSVADEWACIQEEYKQNKSNKEAAWGSATVAEWTAYNTAYTTLQTYVDTLALADRADNTTIVKSTFQANFANYYSANVAFLNALSKKAAELEVAAMEIGGRNLLRDSAIFTHKAGASDDYSFKKLTPTVGLQPDTNYVFSVDKGEMTAGSDTAFTVYLFSSDIRTARNKLTIPISPIRQSVSFKTTAAVTDTDVVLIYAGQHGTTAGKAIKLTNIKLEKGTKATDWTPAPEDVDAAIAAVDSSAQALEYLKEALANETEATGGIVATTSIQLRDWTGENNSDGTKKYKINAGLSGLDDDNVLMWGGGDYTDAVTAAKNSDPESGNGTYNKKDGSEITTLIKKDGTGKIGIFKVDDTKAVINVPNQGKVIIDASDKSGGIFIHDEDNIPRVILSPNTISGSGYQPNNVDVLGGTKNGSSSVNGSTSTYTATTTLTLFSKFINYDGTFNLSTLNISISDINTIVSGITSMNYTSATIVDVDIQVKNGTKTMSIGSFSTLRGGTDGSTNISSKKISVQKGTVEIQLVVSSRIVGTALERPTTCSFSYGSYLSSELEPFYSPKTIICKDGIISAYDSRKYFMVQNTSNGQKIFAKGLSDGADRTAGSGELYVSSDFINAFKDLCAALKEFFPKARTIGANKTNADICTEKVVAIEKELSITSLIANS